MGVAAEIKYFSMEEIKKNNGTDTDRIWIIVKDVVYDVTDYVKKDDHPGGVDLITEWAGKNATKEFDMAGHSGDAVKEMKQYKIGEVALEDRNKKKNVKAKEANNNNNVEKGPKVIEAKEPTENNRSFVSVVFCGMCG